MKKLIAMLTIVFSMFLFMSCEKTEIESINEPPSLKSVTSDWEYLDSIQGVFASPWATGGWGWIVWNPQTQAMDSVIQYYIFSNDTLTWVQWNISQDMLWINYDGWWGNGWEEGAHPTPYYNYVITDIEEIYHFGPGDYDLNISYNCDSAGITLFSDLFLYERYSNSYAPFIKIPTFIDVGFYPSTLPGSIEPSVIYAPSLTFTPLKDTLSYVILNWVKGDDVVEGWFLYIEKDGILIENGIIVYDDMTTDSYKIYHNYYYDGIGIYKYYVKSFSSFGVSEISNETTFEVKIEVLATALTVKTQ